MANRRFKKNTTKKDTMGKIKHIKTIVDGITFDSKMESDFYAKLKEDKINGLIKDFELQPEFLLQDKYGLIGIADLEGKLIIPIENKAIYLLDID